ncbi:MAG: formate/nitrite transporter family protein [Mycoplasmataceae bacterium]|nr:formate/nitrite transporter family protein [Mycoplasmataceae bacterium]
MYTSYDPSLSPKEATNAISKLGIKKSNTKIWQLLILGILAGLYIGFGGQLYLVTIASGLSKILGGIMFSVGLILVIVAGAELFTGNVTILIGVLSSAITKKNMLKNWSVVYIGNLIGSVLFAWLIYQSGLLGKAGDLNDLGGLAVKVAEYKLGIPFVQAFIRGIFCNILVILAIIMAIMAKDIISKIFCIIFPITCFVACGFEHCVANMYLIPLGLLAKGIPLYKTFVMFENIIPVTLGNIVGGIFILTIHPNRIRQIKTLFRIKYSKVK